MVRENPNYGLIDAEFQGLSNGVVFLEKFNQNLELDIF